MGANRNQANFIRQTKLIEQIPRQQAEQSVVFADRAISKGQADPTSLASIFGLPPDNLLDVTNRKILDSMPVCHFHPSTPDFSRGLDLFQLKSAWEEDTSGPGQLGYTKLLEDHGFRTPNTAGQGIKVAYLADNFPTDTFTNEYGENFLQKFTDVASEGAASLAQIAGTTTATGAIEKLLAPVVGTFPTIGGVNLSEQAKAGGAALKEAANKLIKQFNVSGSANMLNRLAAGARIDFPQIWKSSGFQPSYTLTVRLYNPNPRSVESTRRHIVGPMVALMLLAVPKTPDGATYSWPFLHKIVSPGIFTLNPGFIGNITIIKGGDQQQISQQQRLAIVDVRIDMGSLFSTMVAATGSGVQQKTRPSVKKYIEAMLNPSPQRHSVFDRQGIYQMDSRAQLNLAKFKEQTAINREINAGIAQEKVASSPDPLDRVSGALKSVADKLESQLPKGFKIPSL